DQGQTRAAEELAVRARTTSAQPDTLDLQGLFRARDQLRSPRRPVAFEEADSANRDFDQNERLVKASASQTRRCADAVALEKCILRVPRTPPLQVGQELTEVERRVCDVARIRVNQRQTRWRVE